MKRLILLELILLFLATTFRSDSTGGWVQQILPRTDVTVQDIFFIDSLTGHIVVRKNTNDSAFIFKTIDAGSNWTTSFQDNIYLTSIQFVNNNTGFSVGSAAPSGIIKKTTNAGQNWFTISTIGAYPIWDLSFINEDTGWICSDDLFAGGIFKTTNGGLNWQQQLGASFSIKKLFMLNKDTGWAGSNEPNGKLYRTTNGGGNWNLQYTFNGSIPGIFFVNRDTGWVTGGGGSTGIMKTTSGGVTWNPANSPTPFGPAQIYFVNNKRGWVGSGFNKIVATIDGENWGYQISPPSDHYIVYFTDSLRGWAGGDNLIRTSDGGGPLTYIGIRPNSTIVPAFELKQNYPNPFNPSTSIDFDVKKNSRISLRVFSVDGREVDELLDYEKFTTGSYYVRYEVSNRLASGVYFYQMTGGTDDGKEIFIDTKKMILLK